MSLPVSLMEFQFSFPLFFTFLLFLFIFSKTVIGSKGRSGRCPKLPPGPRKLPFIGNLHQLSGAALPHHSLSDLAKKYGPIMHLKLGEISAIVISSPEAAKEVMKTHDLTFSSRAELMSSKIMSYNNSMVFAPYGHYWRQLRKIVVLELLTSHRIRSFRSIREEEVRNLVEWISISSSSGLAVDLSEKIFQLTNNITSRILFGKRCKYQDVFIRQIKEVIELSSGFDLPDLFPSLKFLHLISRSMPALEKNHRRMDKILDDIINEHKEGRMVSGERAAGNQDLLDVLLQIMDSNDLEVPITINNVKAVILEIFAAGSDTSSTVIEWAMSEMLRNPRVMNKAQAEVRQVYKEKGKIEESNLPEFNYLKLVIKETLRLHPPAPLLIPREARERCELNGYEIPIKTKAMINAGAIGRDPKHWVNAECFEPERFSESSVDFKGANFEFIPFGAGRRICPGIAFGILNVELPLANLLCHFDWKPANGIKPEELDMTEKFGAVASRKNHLYCIPSVTK